MSFFVEVKEVQFAISIADDCFLLDREALDDADTGGQVLRLPGGLLAIASPAREQAGAVSCQNELSLVM